MTPLGRAVLGSGVLIQAVAGLDPKTRKPLEETVTLENGCPK